MTAQRKPSEPADIPGRIWVAKGSEAWRLWSAWYRRTKGVAAPEMPSRPGWYFPSQFPPVEPPIKPHWSDGT